MIRQVETADVEVITSIYNEYIGNSTITFETEPLTSEKMQSRIVEISASFPYFVYENADGTIAGYCYAHHWKSRAAYDETLETTVYLASDFIGKGIGKALMQRLIDECRLKGYHALIACITAENQSSRSFHEKLGFKQVSHFVEVGQKFGRQLDVFDYELLL